MLKAMLKHLDSAKRPEEVDAWLEKTRMERHDFEDESRTVPIARLHFALRAFVDIAGQGAVDECAVHLLAPDNLGNWTRMLRGSTSPLEALATLEHGDSDLMRTVKWETLSRSPSEWRGRASLSHDPALESDGLLRASRMAELSMVPVLFGLERGTVSSLEKTSGEGLIQEFTVHWKHPDGARTMMAGVGGGFVVGGICFLASPTTLGAVCLVASSVTGGLAALTVSRDRARRTESLAQKTRVYALERSLLIRDQRQANKSATLEGTVVAGQYRIVRRMGSGGSGVIYEAVRASDGLPVAIKLLRAVAAHEAVASDRLRREAEALGLAWHPNVVDVIEHGHLPDGTSYLVMELLRGETLAARLEKTRRLLPSELLPIAMQVCDALVAVHAAGVVHRDLKPSNVFLLDPPPATEARDSSPGGTRVKLIDFGIARVEWEETRITNIGAPVGTPGYMSPEQEAGGPIDARSDVFSFGAMLYECLLGETAPPAKIASIAPPSSRSGDSAPPSNAPSGVRSAKRAVPFAWQAFLSRAMAVEPGDRFPDARTMAQALREIVEEVNPSTVKSPG
jgi:serine/threonine-protein kinase